MSVEPWMFAWPRSAMIPPPGRPMLPSRSCTIDAARVLHRRVGVRRLAVRQRQPVRPVGLLAGHVGARLALARRELAARVLVAPRARLVDAVLGDEAGEEAVEVLDVLEVLVDDRRPVRERADVLAELAAVL